MELKHHQDDSSRARQHISCLFEACLCRSLNLTPTQKGFNHHLPTVEEMAEQVAATDPRAVALARRVIGNLVRPGIASSMADERTFQTRLNQERT